MNTTIKVTIKRGMYIRSIPEFSLTNKVGELKFNQPYVILATTKRDGWLWGRGELGWIPLANGKNLHVERVQGNPLPL